MPFMLGGVGVSYERDTTSLTLRNEVIDQSLQVENSGAFPAFTIGAGAQIPLGRARSWYVEVGGAYYWGRLDQDAPAEGALAPGPMVRADNDARGPNYWVGVGARF